MLRFGVSAALVVTVLFGGGSAFAQHEDDEITAQEGAIDDDTPPRNEREEEARSLFRAAESALADGRYDNALDYFRRAHELSGYPELLFNIGVACDHLHRTDEALESFESYLEALPDAANREEVEERIASLREIRDSRGPTPDDGVQTQSQSSGPGPVPLVLTIGGGVLAAAGAIFLGYALSEKSALDDIPMDTVWADVSARHDLVPAFSATGIVMLGLGAAALTAGLIWLFTGSSAEEAPVTALVGPGFIGVRGRL